MKLRPKILGALAVTLIPATAIVYLATNQIVLGGFSDLEEAQAARNLDRVEQALDLEVGRLDSVAGDWSGWDESYAFVQGENPEYVDVNLSESTFVTLNVDMMLFFDTEGDLVFGRAVDLQEGTVIELNDMTVSAIASNAGLVSFESIDGAVSGVVTTPSGTLVVASRPVLTSEREGPIAGALVMARPLDERLLGEIANVTQLSLTAYPSGMGSATGGLDAGSQMIEVRSSDRLSGYTVIGDVDGDAALTFEVDMARSIYAEGQKTLDFLLIALLIIGVAIALLVGALMEVSVLRPVARLSSFVASVGTTLTARVKASGRDEIGHLGRSINKMLDSIERYSAEREALNSQLQEERERIVELNRGLEDTVAQRTDDLKSANEELRERNKQLLKAMKQASTDGMTGLLNHRTFQEHIRVSVENGDYGDGQLAVMMVDIDGFKQVNDRLGHQEGDRILIEVGRALKRVAGEKCVFRYGGDEFAVCAEIRAETEAVSLGEKLRENVLQACADSGLTVSIGISLFPEKASSAEELIYQADAAMYEAKGAGKNRVRMSPKVRAAVAG